jgi:hypothetical protein
MNSWGHATRREYHNLSCNLKVVSIILSIPNETTVESNQIISLYPRRLWRETFIAEYGTLQKGHYWLYMFSVLFPKSWRGQQLAKPPSDEVVNRLSMSCWSCYSFTASRYRRQIVVPTELMDCYEYWCWCPDAVRSTELGWIFATNNKILSSAAKSLRKWKSKMMTKFWHSGENRRCTTICRYWKVYYSFELLCTRFEHYRQNILE